MELVMITRKNESDFFLQHGDYVLYHHIMDRCIPCNVRCRYQLFVDGLLRLENTPLFIWHPKYAQCTKGKHSD